jgi:hypothetical protein
MSVRIKQIRPFQSPTCLCQEMQGKCLTRSAVADADIDTDAVGATCPGPRDPPEGVMATSND